MKEVFLSELPHMTGGWQRVSDRYTGCTVSHITESIIELTRDSGSTSTHFLRICTKKSCY